MLGQCDNDWDASVKANNTFGILATENEWQLHVVHDSTKTQQVYRKSCSKCSGMAI
jgi:hypothetical protein